MPSRAKFLIEDELDDRLEQALETAPEVEREALTKRVEAEWNNFLEQNPIFVQNQIDRARRGRAGSDEDTQRDSVYEAAHAIYTELEDRIPSTIGTDQFWNSMYDTVMQYCIDRVEVNFDEDDEADESSRRS